MTAQAYNALDGDSLGADKIIRATTMQSLYDNPTAIAQRGSGAPWNNGVGAIAVLTSGSGNWTVPDGVYRIKVTAIGAGGGGGSWLLYTSDAADELLCVDLGGRRTIQKKKIPTQLSTTRISQ